jgi:hypothetical protein
MFKFLIEGLTDAAGFVVGTMMGYGLGITFGLKLFADGYEAGSMAAIILVGLGGGIGLQAARLWRQKKWPKQDAPE